MKLSIIVPIYNVEKYIIECLSSIYNGKLKDFEVICVDDCGKDKSIELVKKYVKDNKIKNLKIITHDKNKGLSAARNTGIKEATGDYLLFLDSDDMLITNKLNKLINYAKKNNLDVLECEIEEIYETNMNIKVDHSNSRTETEILSGEDYFSYISKNNEYIPMVWSRLYKTDYIKDNYSFKDGLKFEDEEFSPRVLINAKKVQYLNEKIYVYRRRDDSITTNMVKNNNWMEHYFIIIDSLLDFSKTIQKKETFLALKYRIENLVLSLLKNPIAYNANSEILKEAIEIIKEKNIYIIPLKSRCLSIKFQGFLMKYPKLFMKIYNLRMKRG